MKKLKLRVSEIMIIVLVSLMLIKILLHCLFDINVNIPKEWFLIK